MGYYSQNSNIIGVPRQNRTGVHDLVNSQINWDIVPDDLYLHLDAGRTESYPGSGLTWYDLSGNGFNATRSGNITHYKSTADHFVDDGFFHCPGNNNAQKFSLGNSLDFGNQFTICTLIRPLAPDGDIRALMCNIDPGPTTEGWLIGQNTWQTTDRKFRVSVGEGTGSSYKTNVYSAANSYIVGPPSWLFMVWILDKTNNTTTVLKNHVALISGASLGGRNFDVSGKDVTIGAYNSVSSTFNTSYPWTGHISAILVYKKILSSAEQWHNFSYYKRRHGGAWA